MYGSSAFGWMLSTKTHKQFMVFNKKTGLLDIFITPVRDIFITYITNLQRAQLHHLSWAALVYDNMNSKRSIFCSQQAVPVVTSQAVHAHAHVYMYTSTCT